MTTFDFEQQLSISELDEITLLLVALSKEKITNVNRRRELLERFKSEGFVNKLKFDLSNLLSRETLIEAEKEIEDAKNKNIFVVSFFSPDYPIKLKEIDDPPLVLFVRGNKPFPWQSGLQEFGVAVVGARQASTYGRKHSENIAYELSVSGGYLVSGLAIGIDGSAHFGALRGVENSELKLSAGVAVLGSGVLSVYPSEHTELSYKIIENNGVLVSEYGLYHGPRAYRFLERNRIVSGLSEIVIIVEAGVRSGALCTARLASEQGREVFAVPGPIESPTSKGIIQLLKQGAIPFSSFEDAVQEIPRLTMKDLFSKKIREEKKENVETKNLVISLSKSYQEELDNRLSEIVVESSEMDLARKLMKILASTKDSDIDKLVDDMGLSAEKLLVVLSKLQIIGVVEQGAGNTYNLASG